jgi:hypothetical protein
VDSKLPETSREPLADTAARWLGALVVSAVVLLLAGLLVESARGPGQLPTVLLEAGEIVIVAAPVVVLIRIALGVRSARLLWFALGAVMVAAAGAFLAR